MRLTKEQRERLIGKITQYLSEEDAIDFREFIADDNMITTFPEDMMLIVECNVERLYEEIWERGN